MIFPKTKMPRHADQTGDLHTNNFTTRHTILLNSIQVNGKMADSMVKALLNTQMVPGMRENLLRAADQAREPWSLPITRFIRVNGKMTGLTAQEPSSFPIAENTRGISKTAS